MCATTTVCCDCTEVLFVDCECWKGDSTFVAVEGRELVLLRCLRPEGKGLSSLPWIVVSWAGSANVEEVQLVAAAWEEVSDEKDEAE